MQHGQNTELGGANGGQIVEYGEVLARNLGSPCLVTSNFLNKLGMQSSVPGIHVISIHQPSD